MGLKPLDILYVRWLAPEVFGRLLCGMHFVGYDSRLR